MIYYNKMEIIVAMVLFEWAHQKVNLTATISEIGYLLLPSRHYCWKIAKAM